MTAENSSTIVYLSHGGGPLPILGDPGHQKMIQFMQKLPEIIPKPKNILVISAHWEEPVPTVLGAAEPPMFYDYYGFPEPAYQIDYPARGNPALARRITEALAKEGIPASINSRRGFDHGLFIPLNLMFPDAAIPAVQLSLRQGLSPVEHLALGKALRNLEEEELLVIGSGFSFHNMSAFFHHDPQMLEPRNHAFQSWLIETITSPMEQTERETRLANWERAPHARFCHPREEHLLPLHVCAGLAGRAGELIFDDQIMGVRCAAFLWD